MEINRSLFSFMGVSADLCNRLRRTAMSVTLIFMTVTALAQMPYTTLPMYAHRFPEMPPLRVDFDMPLFAHSLSSLPHMSTGDLGNMRTGMTQSVLYRHTENMEVPHFNFKTRVRNVETGDPLIDIRDRIVRKRREKEGRPLPPPPPSLLFRNR